VSKDQGKQILIAEALDKLLEIEQLCRFQSASSLALFEADTDLSHEIIMGYRLNSRWLHSNIEELKAQFEQLRKL
jgi:hypothetical protein